MGALSKRAAGAALIDANIGLFACPICQSPCRSMIKGGLHVQQTIPLILLSKVM